MKQTIKQRLIEYINYKRIGQGKFERSVGFSNGYINNIKGTFGADKLEKIFCVYSDLNREWLLTGKGKMLKDELKESVKLLQSTQPEDSVEWLKRRVEELIEVNERNSKNISLLIEENIRFSRRLDEIISIHSKCFDDIKKAAIQKGCEEIEEYEAEKAKRGGTANSDTGKVKLANK